MKNGADPDPKAVIPDPKAVIPDPTLLQTPALIPDPIYLATTLTYMLCILVESCALNFQELVIMLDVGSLSLIFNFEC